jgi:hypothetical protein
MYVFCCECEIKRKELKSGERMKNAYNKKQKKKTEASPAPPPRINIGSNTNIKPQTHAPDGKTPPSPCRSTSCAEIVPLHSDLYHSA